MKTNNFNYSDLFSQKLPFLVEETENYALVYKPSNMHCVHNEKKNNSALLDWYNDSFHALTPIKGRNKGEGGLLYRLDFLTQGLVLFAKKQQFFEHYIALQNDGKVFKKYLALCKKETKLCARGYPAAPVVNAYPTEIKSFFRAYGPGRKEVRPVLDIDKTNKKIAFGTSVPYKTEITCVKEMDDFFNDIKRKEIFKFFIVLRRGFRHQIRCHLSWIHCPIIGDPIYGSTSVLKDENFLNGMLGLFCYGISFFDLTGKYVDCMLKFEATMEFANMFSQILINT